MAGQEDQPFAEKEADQEVDSQIDNYSFLSQLIFSLVSYLRI